MIIYLEEVQVQSKLVLHSKNWLRILNPLFFDKQTADINLFQSLCNTLMEIWNEFSHKKYITWKLWEARPLLWEIDKIIKNFNALWL